MFLSENERIIQTTAREFAKKEVAPIASEIDRTAEFPISLHKKMAEVGFLGMIFPAQYGGADSNYLSYVLVVEELAKASATVSDLLLSEMSSSGVILRGGTDIQKEKYLSSIATADITPAYALTEPNAGSDLSSIKTKARKEDFGYVLDGSKTLITLAAQADIAIVLAVTDANKGVHGMSVFIAEEFLKGKHEDTMGLRGLGTGELIFQDSRVDKTQLVGTENEGFSLIMETLDSGRIAVAALSVGLAQAALDESIRYSREREQFGRSISTFQGIQFLLADMATEVDAARLLTYRAAVLKDHGSSYSREASEAKLFASDTAMKCATDGLQIHGGYGYTKDYAIERIFRDAKICQIFEGTNQIQRIVIARNLLKG